ncbi:hypothetical protein DAPPUDRAFT_97511 [Daphnia pulex]|uniref:Uncharacterized protein n=1 Tax=Daphnia pulex TaxID=6669 RepID=E9G1J6_DAPPU|nr:hypothetical protein DAPPUDRAFT_97511 [Daphnia pulex]|eukprot:EFX86801.1 hypothetical protein DAPPUDRAFT_97511 [Daphnia pulex]
MASSWHLKCSIPMARFKGRAQSISLPTGSSHRGGGASPQLDVIDIIRLESISCRLVKWEARIFVFVFQVELEMDPKSKPEIGLDVQWEKKIQMAEEKYDLVFTLRNKFAPDKQKEMRRQLMETPKHNLSEIWIVCLALALYCLSSGEHGILRGKLYTGGKK